MHRLLQAITVERLTCFGAGLAVAVVALVAAQLVFGPVPPSAAAAAVPAQSATRTVPATFEPRPTRTPLATPTPWPTHTPWPTRTPRPSSTPRPTPAPWPTHTPRPTLTPWPTPAPDLSVDVASYTRQITALADAVSTATTQLRCRATPTTAAACG